MSWIALSKDDIAARIDEPSLAAIRDRFVDTSVDPMVALIADVTALVRGQVQSNENFTVEADTTLIPIELKDDAAWLVIEGLKLRLGDATPITEAQRKRIDLARERMKGVANGEISVSKPTAPLTSKPQSGGSLQVVGAQERRIDRDRTRGLF